MTDPAKTELPNPGDRLVDRYTILQRVSLGGFGAVYRALQDNLGREIALKVLQPDVVSSNTDYIEQFRQEALLTSQLRHPNTITIFDYGQTETGLLFLVMEWLDGKTLTDVLKEEGALSYDRCLHISNQILKSLSEAHERGMVHRDLKPSNLMLCVQYGEPDFVKVLDFGLVKNLSSEPQSIGGKQVDAPQFTAKRRAPGTPHYMAPEQAMGKGTTTSADIYAFGLILYEMLTGKRAVDGNDKMEVLLKQVRQPIPPLPDEIRDSFLGKVVARCVEKDPLKRPQNAGALLRDYQLNQETRGIEINNADVEASARWKSLAETRVVSDVSGTIKDIFVGRNEEIEEFQSIIQKGMEKNSGMALVVTGPTGMGKTSLVGRFSEYFAEHTHGIRINAGFLPQSNRPYSGIRTAIKNFLNVQATEQMQIQLEVKRALAKFDISDAYLVTFITHFISGKPGHGEEENEQTEIRVEEFFDLLSRMAPVMFTVENIHWADSESLNLLWKIALAAVSRHRPFFFVATYRRQELAQNRELQTLLERLSRIDHVYYREMTLKNLGKKECANVIENSVKMQRPMANQCIQLSKGNPLFLNLVLRFILDEKMAADDGKLVIPKSIEKIAIKRIDQVVRKYTQPDYRDILRCAALMGETFAVNAVEALLRRAGQYNLLDITGRALEVWRKEGILRRQRDVDLSFEFVHPHIVEYFNMEATPEMHLNVARTKETLASSDGGIRLEDIAMHFKMAGDKKNALRYLEFASKSALQNADLLKARKHLEEMIPLFESEATSDTVKNVYYQLGELTLRLSEYGPSKDYFAKAVSLAQARGDHQLEGLACCGLAELALAQNMIEEASACYNRAKHSLREDDPSVQSKLLLGMGKLSKLKADWQAALACFQKAYDYSSNAANFDLMGNALYELGVIYLSLGAARKAHECFVSAQKNYQTVNNTADEANVLIGLAQTYAIFIRADDARVSCDAAIEIFQKLGDQIGYAHALAQMGALNIGQLSFDEAQKFILKARPIFTEFHDSVGNACCQSLLSEIELVHGQLDNAVNLATQAAAVYQDTDNFEEQVHLATMLGKCALLQNDLDGAQASLTQAETYLDVHQSNTGRPELYRVFGLLCEFRGDFATAANYYQRAQEIAQQCEYLEQIYLARLDVLKINVFFSPGRWYYDEMLKIANECRTYGLKMAQLVALLLIVWFEGVYGEQRAWENLMGELTRFVQMQQLPVQGLLRRFEFIGGVLRFASPEVSSSLQRSAGWIRDALSQPRK